MSALDLAQALWLLVAAVGLSLSVSWAAMPVLGMGAFVAVGGYGTALLGPGGAGWPLGLAVLTAVAVAAVTGHLVARAASRLEGAPLALATWALAWLVQVALLSYPDRTGGVDGLTRPAPAHLVSPVLGLDVELTPRVHVLLAGGVCVVLLLGLRRLGQGPGGLDLAALREGPALAAGLGIPVAARRRTVLTVTAALGALSGAGTLVLLGLVSPSDVDPTFSLELLVAVLLGGTARWWGPVLGVAVLTALPHVADGIAHGADVDAERARGVLTAALLLGVLLLRRLVAARFRRTGKAPGPAAAVAPGAPHHPGDVLLRAEHVTVAYDGVLALDDVALDVRAGEVHALVGPNGSGKSTLLKVLAGELAGGEVEVAGLPHRARGPQDRVRAGIARTPQQTVVLARLPAEGQVAVGARGGSRERWAVLRHLLATPSSRADTLGPAVDGALCDTGLSHLREADTSRVAAGDQRVLQVARAAATGAAVLLLDEPAAGMTSAERTRLRTVLRRLVGNGTGVLLVEHDMRLVGDVADRVTVLDAGRVLSTGTMEAVREDPAVRRAYLGDEPVEKEVHA